MATIYDELNDLCLILEQQGLGTISRSIQEAIAAGSTGTEILMAVKSRLQEIKNRSMTSSCKQSVNALIDKIDGLLR